MQLEHPCFVFIPPPPSLSFFAAACGFCCELPVTSSLLVLFDHLGEILELEYQLQ